MQGRRGILPERFYQYLDTVIIPRAAWLSDIPIINAVRSGLVLALPLVMMAAFAALIGNFPLEAYQDFMLETFGPDWTDLPNMVSNGTFGIIAIIVVFSIGPYLTQIHNRHQVLTNVNPLITGLVSLSSLLVLIDPVLLADPGGQFLPLRWVGVSGLFLAMLVGLTSTFIFLSLSSLRLLRINLPGSIDSATLQSFNVLAPAILTVLLFAIFGHVVKSFWGVSIHEGAYDLLRSLFTMPGEGLAAGLLYNFALHLLWFFGVHGANVLDPITHEVYQSAMNANALAFAQNIPPPHIITKTFFDVYVFMGGSGASLCLIFSTLIFSNQPSKRRVVQIAALPAIFNINEIILFGLPVILNPIMLIPFILTPIVLSLVSYYAVQWGVAPTPAVQVGWTTPIFLSGYLSSGAHTLGSGPFNLTAAAIATISLQFFNLVLGTLIYAPFAMMGDRVQERQTRQTFKELFTTAITVDSNTATRNILVRPDRIGALGRALLADLEQGIKKPDSGLFMVYQPQVNSADGRVCGVEALLRWNHPLYGMIAPPITVSLAEEGGLIQELGGRVLDEACGTLRKWMDEGVADLVMAVNVSTLQLAPELLGQVEAVLEKYKLEGSLVEIEITESSALDTDSPGSHFLAQLHERGLRLAIDDFGMGHSSLKYLKQFPVDVIKIDGAITREVETNDMCVDIVAAITRLCRTRNMMSIVEFVENENQIRILTENGCDVFQGYYFSKPLLAEECLDFILENFRSRDPS